MRRWGAPGVALLLALWLGLASAPAAARPQQANPTPLRRLAAHAGLPYIGITDGDMGSLLYRNTIPRDFNSLTPESLFKFEFIHPCPPAWLIDAEQFPDSFNPTVYAWVTTHGNDHPNPAYRCSVDNAASHEWEWGAADARVAFAEQHRMRLFAHTLLWHVANPAWLTDPAVTLSVAERERLMEEHIRGAARHLAASDALYGIDVVNEGIAPDGSLLPLSPWAAIPNYIHKAFVIAREELDTMGRGDVRLFYNDYEIEYRYERAYTGFVNPPGCYRKSDAVYEYLRRLIEEQGAPIDGIGFQTHLVVTGEAQDSCDAPTGVFTHDTRRMVAAMRRFAGLGLEVRISEMDVARRGDALDDETFSAIQADYFGGALSACLYMKGVCTGYTVWGTHDGASWYNGRAGFPAPNPLLFDAPPMQVYEPTEGGCIAPPRRITDERYCPKAGYTAIRTALERAAARAVIQSLPR